MPIPDSEKKRYSEFASDIARDLGSLLIEPDAVLWHYTNGSALLAIIETMSLFATQISCLNDATELRYGSKLFREALSSLKAGASNDSVETALLDGALTYFQENPDFPAQAVVPQFVACFSEERDDLSQWKAYGGGENGYAIGFKARDLWGCQDTVLVRASYDSTLRQTLALKAARRMVQFFLDAMEICSPLDLISFGREFLEAWDRAITLVAPLIKDPSFARERECRLVKGFTLDELPTLKFIQKGSLMSRHIPLRPPSGLGRLPIAEVLVGPCRHAQISRTSVDTLLRQKGYATGLVSISKIPYRIT